MPNTIFSTYKQGENRVTSTFLAVLENINNQLTEDILEGLVEESDISFVTFENQSHRGDSVPDAVIQGTSSIWIETKTSRNSVDKGQIEDHLRALQSSDDEDGRLIVLTPDGDKPSNDLPNNESVVWANFDSLIDTIQNILNRDSGSAESSLHIPTQREAYLLREFVRFLYDEELDTGKDDRVLVVAARKAWPEYQETELYFCQPHRSFKPSSHLAFYTDGVVKPEVPRIESTIESVTIEEKSIKSHSELDGQQEKKLLAVCSEAKENSHDRYGNNLKVLFLSPSSGLELEYEIQNDKTATDSDRRVAFVQGHRYVSLKKLERNPEKTSELEE